MLRVSAVFRRMRMSNPPDLQQPLQDNPGGLGAALIANVTSTEQEIAINSEPDPTILKARCPSYVLRNIINNLFVLLLFC